MCVCVCVCAEYIACHCSIAVIKYYSEHVWRPHKAKRRKQREQPAGAAPSADNDSSRPRPSEEEEEEEEGRTTDSSNVDNEVITRPDERSNPSEAATQRDSEEVHIL